MTRVYLPADTAALALGADGVAAALARNGVEVVRTGSRGMAWLEPLLEVDSPGGRIGYAPVTPEDVAGLLPVLNDGQPHPLCIGRVEEHDWMRAQTRITFARCGVIDPLSVDDFVAHGGLRGLKRAIEIGQAATLQEMIASGLRGRGGAGFPAGVKWKSAAEAAGERKYIVCNADEGDSGTFADRMLMEGDPMALIEGMALAAFAIGATKGFVYARSEYPHANAAFAEALDAVRATGGLGPNALGPHWPFDIELRIGAGAYVCGEETALLESLEGKRGQPRLKPPFPANAGVYGCPTTVNNVESIAVVPGSSGVYDHASIRSTSPSRSFTARTSRLLSQLPSRNETRSR